MNKRKTDQLQFFRFSAIFWVFNFHALIHNVGDLVPDYNRWFSIGLSGVVFFFILSGFISGYYSYEKDITVTFSGIVSYVKQKLKKLYPLYLAVTLYSVIFSEIPELIATRSWGALKYPLMLLGRHLLLLQSWMKIFPGEYFRFSEVGWFLSTLLLMHILNLPMRALATRIRKKKNSTVIFAIICIASAAASILWCYLARGMDIEFWACTVPFSRLGEYVCGMALGYALYPIVGRIEDNKKNRIVFTILEVIAIAAWLMWGRLGYPEWAQRIANWFVPNIILLTVFTPGAGYVSSLLRLKPLKALGDKSFNFYLIHSMVINTYLAATGYDPAVTATKFSYLFCFGISLLISFLIGEDGRRHASSQASNRSVQGPSPQ
ncbi:MAG: acyltransferase family protein [Lachnospiraceae bacterium]|nr:acyltransferase family protein [Lachnospiraceae bacterium]